MAGLVQLLGLASVPVQTMKSLLPSQGVVNLPRHTGVPRGISPGASGVPRTIDCSLTRWATTALISSAEGYIVMHGSVMGCSGFPRNI